AASALLDTADLGPLDELQRARVLRLRAQVAFATSRGRDAPRLLVRAARSLEPLDQALARETYLEALASAIFAGRLGTGPDPREVAEAADAAIQVWGARSAERLLEGLVTRYIGGYEAAVKPLSGALRSFAEIDEDDDDVRWLWLACRMAQDL